MADSEPARTYRGSRRHVLDWTDRPSFGNEFGELLSSGAARIELTDDWMPRGWAARREARLETFRPQAFANHPAWSELRQWWLGDGTGNTPNWDIAASCSIGGTKALVLVEAKANVAELKRQGKTVVEHATPQSAQNHEHIQGAIDQACGALHALDPSINISCNSHYQLANRISFAWKLASLGVPVVLVYLGFIGDEGLKVGDPFLSEGAWVQAFESYVQGVVPAALFEKRLEIHAPLWILSRSRRVLSHSPPPTKRVKMKQRR